MNIFVISLIRSTERRKRIQKLLDAIDGSEPNFLHADKAQPELTQLRKRYRLKPEEIACFASHFELWMHCIELEQPITILEDDIDIHPDALNIMQQVYSLIQQYHYIKLSATCEDRIFYPILPLINGFILGSYHKQTLGATAYIISPTAAQSFVHNATRFLEPVDDYMEKPWRHSVQTYSIVPALFRHTAVESTIGKRKIKPKPMFHARLYSEGYRLYETVMRIIYWKNKK